MAGKRKGVGKVVARSATSALNLGVFGAAAVGAVALASWPIAALGGAAYAALVASDVASPEFRRRVLRRGPEAQMPRAKDLPDDELRHLVVDLTTARDDIGTTVDELPERVRRNLGTTLDALEELWGHAATLVTRALSLGRYLDRTDAQQARIEVTELRARAQETLDPSASREYQLAAGAAAERASALAELAAGRERILANLTRILATLRAVPPKLVRMRTLDDQASDSLTGDFDRELGRMNTDLRAFEETLQSLVEVPR